MGLISWFFGRGGDTVTQGVQIPYRAPKESATTVNFDSAMSISACWASIRLITEVVAAMPLKCLEIDPATGVKKPKTDYRLYRRLNYKPNRYQTRTEFFESIVLNLASRGNSYCSVERVGDEIISIIPLPAGQVEVEILSDGEKIFNYYDLDGNIKVYSEQSIWHLPLFGNGYVGLSPLGYAARSISIAIDSDKRVSKLAASGGKSTGILTIDEALKPNQRETIKQNFKNMQEGSADGLFVLEAGFKYQQTSMSPADMQLIENRRFQVEDIARFFGVPSVLINDTSATTAWGSGIQQINEGFYKLNLRPYLERIESSIKRWLMPEKDWDSIDIEFDFDSLLRADMVTRIDGYSKAINSGQMTPNEARAREGRESKDGGDDIYLNGTLVPAGQNPNTLGGEQSGN